jgi:hypothetical protein
MNFKRLTRVTKWATLALLLLALYLASAPLAFYWSNARFPSALPVLFKIYAPTVVYLQNPDWPGSGAYQAYTDWCRREFYLRFEYVPDSERALAEPSQIAFHGTPLRDVAVYLSQIHNCNVDLTQDAKWDSEITREATAPLREHLEQITQPLGLTFAAAGEHIIVGPPATIEQLIAKNDAAARAIKLPGNVIVRGVIACVVVIAALVLHRWRRRGATARVSPDP